ncbi:MAG TPA: MogA/MoaB family molybdenum cofactor biosynthesis protein [Methanobacterium sp.]|nr:MogA/MoaB family molybdenum cofactor biosynthesis protein [Methanobacterium sp.]
MSSESMEDHRRRSPLKVKVGVITLSDSRNKKSQKDDISGMIITDSLKDHELVSYNIIPDDADELLKLIEDIIQLNTDVIITTGGTGIGKRDITIETIKPLFDKELNGFGEIFRYETYQELGTGALLTRATAGVYKKTVIISMPGSPNAVTLGMKIILPELGHLVKHAQS